MSRDKSRALQPQKSRDKGRDFATASAFLRPVNEGRFSSPATTKIPQGALAVKGGTHQRPPPQAARSRAQAQRASTASVLDRPST
jgi:hypothetical protein